jgi:2-polyprenyl-6-methoxyphenol hydroxylase-like FAD-dependent oxidoreductase
MQNKFTRCITDTVVDDKNHVSYGTEFVGFDGSDSDGTLIANVKSPSSPSLTTISCKYLIGADGAHSPVRRHVLKTPFTGQPSLQSLINIHFTISPTSTLTAKILNTAPLGMLYFVYNASVIAAFVAHDIARGEYVVQVPFFPPFQSPRDYDVDKCKRLVLAGIVGDGGDGKGIPAEYRDAITIKSIKPWNMSAVVADEYTNGKNVFLVGDAAHVFPPAGGFGMNTGIGDAHSLAWRIGLAHHELADEEESSKLFREYEAERKQVAVQNKELSLRNYDRTLNIARIMGLDADHPKFVISAMTSGPMRYVPEEARKVMFQTMVDTAMLPLKIFDAAKDNAIVRTIAGKIQDLLDGGHGLPLLFPLYELGFVYGKPFRGDGSEDTGLYVGHVEVGARLPHCFVEVVEEDGNTRTCSTIELGRGRLQNTVMVRSDMDEAGVAGLLADGRVARARVVRVRRGGPWEELIRDCGLPFFEKESRSAVVVRPDGHVLEIIR